MRFVKSIGKKKRKKKNEHVNKYEALKDEKKEDHEAGHEIIQTTEVTHDPNSSVYHNNVMNSDIMKSTVVTSKF